MRLVGQAKLGFYPTPISVVEDILRLLDIEPEAKIFDPCCGEGEALHLLQKDFPEAVTYGVELHTERARVAAERLNYSLNCDAIGEIKITNGVFDLLWENPPYDNDLRDENDKSQRLEKKFLENHFKYLKESGGILIYIIPLPVLDKVKTKLIKLTDLKILSFPQGEYEVYKQIVVMGRTTKQITQNLLTGNKEYLEKIIANTPIEAAYKYLETTSECDVVYKVAAAKYDVQTFYTSRINPDAALNLIPSAKINDTFLSSTQTQSITSIRPMAELTEGHIAMLIAAGMMNGLLEADGEKFVVKGFVDRSFKERMEFTEESSKTIRKTQYSIVVNAINLTTKEFVRIAT